MNNDYEKDRFLPALVLGIIGGVFSLGYIRQSIAAVTTSFPFVSFIALLFLVAFPTISIWMGCIGKNAMNSKAPFYILLALAVIKGAVSLSVMAESSMALISGDIPNASLYVLADIISLCSSLFSALAVLFFLLRKRFECRLSAILAVVCFFSCTLPHAYIYATQFNVYIGAVNSLIFFAASVWGLLVSTAGEVLGALALFLYAGKYMPHSGEPADSAEQFNDSGAYAYTAAPNVPNGTSPADIPAPQPQKAKKAKIILAVTIAAAVLCVLSFVGQGLISDIVGQNLEPELYLTQTRSTEKFTSDVSEVTVPLTVCSPREIQFKKKDVTVRFLGAGVDSDDNIWIIADVTNSSSSTVELSAYYDLTVNYYAAYQYCSVVVKPRETLRIKIPTDALLFKLARIDINNISSAYIPMGLSYGKDFKWFDMGDYECQLEFDPPQKYVTETEENKTKAASELCYTDENVDIYYQGRLSDGEDACLAFFVEGKNPDLLYIYADEVSQSADAYSFQAMATFEDETPSVYLYGDIDISSGIPEDFGCNFTYTIFQFTGDNIDRTATFYVDPSKMFGE